MKRFVETNLSSYSTYSGSKRTTFFIEILRFICYAKVVSLKGGENMARIIRNDYLMTPDPADFERKKKEIKKAINRAKEQKKLRKKEKRKNRRKQKQ